MTFNHACLQSGWFKETRISSTSKTWHDQADEERRWKMMIVGSLDAHSMLEVSIW